MNKILIILLVLLVSISSAFALGDLTVSNVVNPTSGNPGTSVLGSFGVNNIGVSTISGIVFVKSDLAQTGNPAEKILSSQVSFNPVSIASLTASPSPFTVTSSVAIPQLTKPGSYTGSVEVRDGSNLAVHSANFQLTVVVNSLPQLNVDTFTETNALEIKEEQGETATGTFIIRNTGNVALSNLDLSHNIALFDDDNDPITLTFAGLPATLAVGSTATITASADIDTDADYGTYSGLVTVKDLVENAEKKFKLDINVEPRACEDGTRSNGNPGGDNLRVEIREPGTNEDFAPGDEITVEVRVDNNDDEDLDVVVEGFLFDLDDNDVLVEGKTDTLEVQEDESEDFEFTLTVPSDVDVDNTFAIFVKAYEDDNEDENCGEAKEDTEIKRERHSVIIEKLVFTPSTLACSETFDASVDIFNIGTSDEDDVTVRLFDDELNIDFVSNEITVDKFDDSGDEATIRFRDLKIPANAEKKQYQIEAILTFDNDETRSEFGTVTVNSCGPAPSVSGESEASLQVLSSSFTIQGGDSFSIPVIVTNSGSTAGQFTLEVQNTEDFAQGSLSRTLALSPGQSETAYFNLRTSEDIEGKYTGTVVLRAGTSVVDTKSFTITAESKKLFSGLGVDLSGTKVFWIIADVILVIIAIFFLKLIFGSKKKKVEQSL